MATATQTKHLTAADIRVAIQTHFGSGGEKYAVLFEVRNGTAWRANRSVDAVVMSLWPSLGMELWGMEIKVSRQDWQRELDDPKKASDVFNHFDRWFLVAPEHIVKPGEIPPPWGWFIPANGMLRQQRPAQKNESAKAVDRHFLAALLRRVAKVDDAFVLSAVNKALSDQREKFKEEIERRSLENLGDLRESAQNWLKLRDLLKEKPADYLFQPEVVNAVKIIMKSGVAQTHNALSRLVTDVDDMKRRLDTIKTELAVGVR